MRSTVHKSKKVYDRKRLKKAGISYSDDLPFSFLCRIWIYTFTCGFLY